MKIFYNNGFIVNKILSVLHEYNSIAEMESFKYYGATDHNKETQIHGAC